MGDWNGDAMDVHTQQWVDFGSNCYAAQSFQHEDRRILIGWISDFYGEHIATEPGAYGSMTLPRELHVKNEHVYTKPVEEVYTLLGDTVYEAQAVRLKSAPLQITDIMHLYHLKKQEISTFFLVRMGINPSV